jgi:hypothetical protein
MPQWPAHSRVERALAVACQTLHNFSWTLLFSPVYCQSLSQLYAEMLHGQQSVLN